MRRIGPRVRIGGRLLSGGAAVLALSALTARYAHREVAGDGRGPAGPRQIIMSQRLSQAVPPHLAGLERTQVLGEDAARAAFDGLAGAGPVPLLDGCGGGYGDPVRLTLWAGTALDAEAAQGIVADLARHLCVDGSGRVCREVPGEPGDVRAAGAGDELAVYARGRRVFCVAAAATVLDAALAQLRSPRPVAAATPATGSE